MTGQRKGRTPKSLLMIVEMMCFVGPTGKNNQNNVVQSFSLLEPDACPVLDGNGETEISMNGEIVLMRLNHACGSGTRLSKPSYYNTAVTGNRQGYPDTAGSGVQGYQGMGMPHSKKADRWVTVSEQIVMSMKGTTISYLVYLIG
jgi:hypothetical protein